MFLINYRNVGRYGAAENMAYDNNITNNNNCPTSIMHESSNEGMSGATSAIVNNAIETMASSLDENMLVE